MEPWRVYIIDQWSQICITLMRIKIRIRINAKSQIQIINTVNKKDPDPRNLFVPGVLFRLVLGPHFQIVDGLVTVVHAVPDNLPQK